MNLACYSEAVLNSHVLCDKLMASQSADADEFTNTKNLRISSSKTNNCGPMAELLPEVARVQVAGTAAYFHGVLADLFGRCRTAMRLLSFL
jgi:hypothetical protein